MTRIDFNFFSAVRKKRNYRSIRVLSSTYLFGVVNFQSTKASKAWRTLLNDKLKNLEVKVHSFAQRLLEGREFEILTVD